jgi:hypothetical protein
MKNIGCFLWIIFLWICALHSAMAQDFSEPINVSNSPGDVIDTLPTIAVD